MIIEINKACCGLVEEILDREERVQQLLETKPIEIDPEGQPVESREGIALFKVHKKKKDKKPKSERKRRRKLRKLRAKREREK